MNADVDVIVIGAGAAGLSAARSLAGRSLHVIVLEARDRIGGRAREDRSARKRVPAELGAEFIHGRARETMALLRDAGIKSVPLEGDVWMCGEDGDLRRDDMDLRSSAIILEDARALAVDESVDRFLHRFEHDKTKQETVMAARAFVEGFEAADPAIASVLSIANEIASGVDFATARPLGGYRPVFELLRKDCEAAGAQIRLSTRARQISWRRGAVEVRASTSSGEERTFHARAVVVTLPVGVLRHSGDESAVVFDPELPAPKRQALKSIEMGHVVRVALWFRTAFWERIQSGRYRDASFFRCLTQPFTGYWTQSPLRSELIVAWAGGPRATALSGASQPELIELALDGFGKLFGEAALAREEFESGVMHDWGDDPFSRGAYSYVAVGGGDARAVLAKTLDGTLFFAGEATSHDGQAGTVNGALKTGARAAAEVATSLGVTA